MTQNEIIAMARQAGFQTIAGIDVIEFAKLVAAKERDVCIDVIETHRIPVGNSAAGEMACEWTYDALKEIVAKIRVRGEA
jgi:hypothetical protein